MPSVCLRSGAGLTLLGFAHTQSQLPDLFLQVGAGSLTNSRVRLLRLPHPDPPEAPSPAMPQQK